MRFIFVILLFIFSTMSNSNVLPVYPRVIQQDNAGFMWFGLINDVVRYDGDELLYLSRYTSDFQKQSVYSIYPEHESIFLATDTGLFKVSSNMDVKMIYRHDQPIYDVAKSNDVYYMIDSEYVYQLHRNELHELAKVNNGKSLYVINEKLFYLDRSGVCIVVIGVQKSQKCLRGKFNSISVLADLVIIGSDDGLTIVNSDLAVLQEFNIGKINRLVVGQNQQIWLVRNETELLLFNLQEGRLREHQFEYSKQQRINDIFQSNDGLLWLAGHTVNMLKPTFYNAVELKKLGVVTGAGGGLLYHQQQRLFGDVNGLISIDDSDNGQLIEHSPTHIYELKSIGVDLYIGAYSGLYIYAENKFKKTIIDTPVLCITEHIDVVYVCTGKSVIKLDQNNNVLDKIDLASEVQDIVIANNMAYIATTDGLFTYNGLNLTTVFNDIGVTELHWSLFGNVVVASTFGDGVKLIDLDSNKITSFNLHLIGGLCERIAEWDLIVWVSCVGGLARINLDNLTLSIYPLTTPVSGIAVDNGIYSAVTTDHRQLTWTNKMENDKYRPSLLISGVAVNGIKNSLASFVAYAGDHIELSYGISDYRGGVYIISVNGTAIRHDNKQNLGLNLPAGQHEIEITAKNTAGNTITRFIDIKIHQPIYLRAGVLFAFAMLIIYVVYTFIERMISLKMLKRQKLAAYFDHQFDFQRTVQHDIYDRALKAMLDAKKQKLFKPDLYENAKQLCNAVEQFNNVYDSDCSLDENIENLITTKNKLHPVDIQFTNKTTTSLPDFVLFKLIQYLLYLAVDMSTDECQFKKIIIELFETKQHIKLNIATTGNGLDLNCFQTHAHESIDKILQLLNARYDSNDCNLTANFHKRNLRFEPLTFTLSERVGIYMKKKLGITYKAFSIFMFYTPPVIGFSAIWMSILEHEKELMFQISQTFLLRLLNL